MSGILGIFQRDGSPLLPALLPAMRDAMRVYQPDGGGLWQHGPAGFGSLLRHNTPESVHEWLPLVRSQPGQGSTPSLVLTAAARLDNREELCDLFAVSPAERSTTPDSRLLLLAYERWGEECPSRLFGDWTFAVWHPREQRLFLSRDHHGNTALYYWNNGRRFAFASDHRALLTLPEVPRRVNELYFASVITVFPDGYHGHDTVYQDIHRLPPAHAMSVTRDGVRVWRYWRLEDAPKLSFHSEDECYEQFRELFAQAVRSRLRSHRPIGVTLSGGLDSGAVAALAGEALGLRSPVSHLASQSVVSSRECPHRTLTGFTSIPVFDVQNLATETRFGNEWSMAALTAKAVGVTEHIPVDARHVSPLDGLREISGIHDEPLHAGGNYFWILAMLEQAKQRGIGTLLTGQMGNMSVSWTGLRPSQTSADLWHRGAFRGLLKQMATNLLPTSWERHIRWAHKSGDLRHFNQPWRSYAAIQPAFARRLHLGERMLAAGHDPTFSQRWPDSRAERFAVLKPGRMMGGALWKQSGAHFGMEVRDPTADVRLMEFCLGIPPHFYRSSGGRDRWVIRRSMEGLLPDEVRLNTKRGLQGADVTRRLAQQRDEIAAELTLVAQSPLAAEYLDLELMQRILNNHLGREDVRSKTLCDCVLLRGLQAGMFLRNFERAGRVTASDWAAA